MVSDHRRVYIGNTRKDIDALPIFYDDDLGGAVGECPVLSHTSEMQQDATLVFCEYFPSRASSFTSRFHQKKSQNSKTYCKSWYHFLASIYYKVCVCRIHLCVEVVLMSTAQHASISAGS